MCTIVQKGQTLAKDRRLPELTASWLFAPSGSRKQRVDWLRLVDRARRYGTGVKLSLGTDPGSASPPQF